MATSDVAQDHHSDRKRLAKNVAAEGRKLWRGISPLRLDEWTAAAAKLLGILAAAQQQAASQADSYADEALQAQGLAAEAAGSVVAAALSGIASDGRSLYGLLLSPMITAKLAIAGGATQSRALAAGEANVDMITRTQVADAGRVADGAAVAARPSVGYVRMLMPPGDCSRCVVLAGRFYRYNTGFARHPRCNCIHVPSKAAEAARSEGLISDPREAFESMTEAEQNKAFTKSGAQAIRDGADIGQVVNARRGMSKAGGRITKEERRILVGGDRAQLQRTRVYGQDVFATTEGTTRRGFAGQRLMEQGARTEAEEGETVTRQSRSGAVERTVKRQRVQTPRLMPESIYEVAKDREDAIRLLKRFGYLI